MITTYLQTNKKNEKDQRIVYIHIDQAWETGKRFWNSPTEIVLAQCPGCGTKIRQTLHDKNRS